MRQWELSNNGMKGKVTKDLNVLDYNEVTYRVMRMLSMGIGGGGYCVMIVLIAG